MLLKHTTWDMDEVFERLRKRPRSEVVCEWLQYIEIAKSFSPPGEKLVNFVSLIRDKDSD